MLSRVTYCHSAQAIIDITLCRTVTPTLANSASRNFLSKEALCATSGVLPMKEAKRRITSELGGALATMLLAIPVKS